MAASGTKPVTITPAALEKKEKNFVPKPEKPNEEQYNKDLAQAEEEHEDIKSQLNAIKEKLSLTQPARRGEGRNQIQARQSDLRAELATIRTKQQDLKASRQKTLDQIRILENAVKIRINDLKNSRAKIPYKSVEDIDKKISSLENEVESGKMKLVDERKALNDISLLKRQRRSFADFAAVQDAIDVDKTKIAESREILEDPELKDLSDRYNEITNELDAIKAEQDEAYKNLNSLRDEKSRLQNLEREKYQAMRKIQDEHYQAVAAFKEYERAAARARRERFRAEREARELERKREFAKRKLEEASIPAFSSEILSCKGLITHFDPNSPESLTAMTKNALLQDKGLKATEIRTVTTELKGTKLLKKDERDDDYFIGAPSKGKRGKKGGNKNDSASGTGSNTPNLEDKGKFQLNHGILAELGKVDVPPPSGWEDVPRLLDKLREKLTWYKENSERVTKESIERARKEIDNLEAGEEAVAAEPTDDKKEDDWQETKDEEVKDGSNEGKDEPIKEEDSKPADEEEVKNNEWI